MSLEDDYDALEAPATRMPRALKVNDLIRGADMNSVYLVAQVGRRKVQLVSLTQPACWSDVIASVTDPTSLTREEAFYLCFGMLKNFHLVEHAFPFLSDESPWRKLTR